VPDTVGVPDISPELALILNPEGSAMALKLVAAGVVVI
jgi:hypothetical protein